MHKRIIVAAIGCFLLLTPAQAQECTSKETVTAFAAEREFAVVFDLHGAAMKQFLESYFAATGQTMNAEEWDQLLDAIDSIVIYKMPDGPMAVIRTFRANCAVGGVPVPAAVIDGIMRKIEQSAERGR